MLTYDPYDPDLLVHGVPFDHLARIRAEDPVCDTPSGAKYVSRRPDVERVLKDVDTFQADLGPITGLTGLEDIPAEQLYLSEILEPRHGQVRRLYNACFGPHRTRMVEDVTADICNELVDAMLAAQERDGSADLHLGYAMPIPGRVMAHVMGLPPEASDKFLAWSADETLMTRPCTPGVEAGGPPIFAFFADELAKQRALPEPDNRVFRVLLEAELDGEPLTDTEIVTQLHFMVMAGVHTTRGMLTHVVQRLLHEPELFERLRTEPDLIPIYVEESLRHDAPVQRTTRRVLVTSLGEALLVPTRIYVKSCLAAVRAGGVKALAHITGGGLLENIPRVLPDSAAAVLDVAAWDLPPVFRWLARAGGIAPREMARTFNCGIGMVVVAAADRADALAALLTEAGETVHDLGRIEARDGGDAVRLANVDNRWALDS